MSDRDPSPEEIESRIHATQQDLRSDIDALEDKVAPENLKQQARERADEAAEQLKDKAVEATQHAGEAVRDRLDDATQQAGEAVRDRFDKATERFRDSDKMPSLSLLGLAAVIGIGLLLVSGSSRNRHDRGHYTRHPDSDYAGDRGYREAPAPRARPSTARRY